MKQLKTKLLTNKSGTDKQTKNDDQTKKAALKLDRIRVRFSKFCRIRIQPEHPSKIELAVFIDQNLFGSGFFPKVGSVTLKKNLFYNSYFIKFSVQSYVVSFWPEKNVTFPD